jgi:hypothetical protein
MNTPCPFLSALLVLSLFTPPPSPPPATCEYPRRDVRQSASGQQGRKEFKGHAVRAGKQDGERGGPDPGKLGVFDVRCQTRVIFLPPTRGGCGITS